MLVWETVIIAIIIHLQGRETLKLHRHHQKIWLLSITAATIKVIIIIFHHEFRPGWPVSVSAVMSSNSVLSGRSCQDSNHIFWNFAFEVSRNNINYGLRVFTRKDRPMQPRDVLWSLIRVTRMTLPCSYHHSDYKVAFLYVKENQLTAAPPPHNHRITSITTTATVVLLLPIPIVATNNNIASFCH